MLELKKLRHRGNSELFFLKNMCSVVSTYTQGKVRYRGRVREEEGEGGKEREGEIARGTLPCIKCSVKWKFMGILGKTSSLFSRQSLE